MVKVLLALRDIDVTVRTFEGLSALHAACFGTQGIRSSLNGDEVASATVLMLIQAGGDVQARGHDGRTPLMYAVAADLSRVVEGLYLAGAGANVKDHAGHTP